MHDETAVRRVHSVAARGDEPQPILERQAPSAAVIRNLLSFHSLHHEVRPSVGCLACVEKPRDTRMLQTREDSPLTRETPQDFAGVHAALDELHRDLLFEPAVGALTEVDLAHPAAPKKMCQAKDSDGRAARVAVLMLAMDVRDCCHHFELLDGCAPLGVRAGFDRCPVDRCAIEHGPRKLADQPYGFIDRHVSSPPPTGRGPAAQTCARHRPSACQVPPPSPRSCSPSRCAQ